MLSPQELQKLLPTLPRISLLGFDSIYLAADAITALMEVSLVFQNPNAAPVDKWLTFLQLAEGSLTEAELGEWIRSREWWKRITDLWCINRVQL